MNNWDNMKTVLVPEGLNGWQHSGKVILNGRAVEFPTGVTTQVPEPVAKYLQKLINDTVYPEISAICPELLADPDVEIYYDPAKTEIVEKEHWKDTGVGPVLYYPNVTTIGKNAFQQATGIEAAIFPKVKMVDRQAFANCSNLKYACFPSLTSVAYASFSSTGIVNADFPALETIDNGYGSTFGSCKSLVSVNMPRLKTIGKNMNGTFSSCSVLEKVNLPALEYVAGDTFSGCTSLKRLDLPKATYLGYNAFRMSGIEALILRSDTVCELYGDGTKIFTNTPIVSGTGYIYVWSSMIEQYQADSVWAASGAQFRAIEDYPDICDPDWAAAQTGYFSVKATVTLNEGSTTEGTCTFDKSYVETAAAIRSGQFVTCTMHAVGDDGVAQYYLPAVMIQNSLGLIFFVLIAGSMTMMIQMHKNGEGSFTQGS